jgi:hypothetical protein
MTRDAFLACLASGIEPDAAPLLRALWHDGHGHWDRAHALAQDEDTLDGARVHAYLHRREGDLGNAGYWYRRAGTTPFTGTMAEEFDALVSALTGN